LLDTRAKGLDEQMLLTASYAIASLVEETQLNEEYVIPKVNDPRILPIVTQTLKKAIRSQSPNGDADNRELRNISDAISQEY
jgi:malate dehydrogenase (oxaloacetate-decarboxylating)